MTTFRTVLVLMWMMVYRVALVESLAFGGEASAQQRNNNLNDHQVLEIAFVTGNEMKVRELTKILAAEGAIDLDHPEKSLGTLMMKKTNARN